MKEYPSIPTFGDNFYNRYKNQNISGFAFAKYDGSCVRIEWNKKNGFHKFGKRHGLLDDSYPILKRFPDLFLSRYGESLAKILTDNRFGEATCFCEFYGPNSFAGVHLETDIQEVRLFDVSVYKRGFLFPEDFRKIFEGIPIQEELYSGILSSEFVESVHNSTLFGMPFEGVVFKSSAFPKSGPFMVKIKSTKWYEKLKEHCKDDMKKFEALK